jgi:hypothetical protein
VAAKRHPAIVRVERILKSQGFRFVYVSPVGWKIYEAKGYEYSWLEYRHDPHTDRVHMNVDKLRDEAENFAHLVTLWHGVVIDY